MKIYEHFLARYEIAVGNARRIYERAALALHSFRTFTGGWKHSSDSTVTSSTTTVSTLSRLERRVLEQARDHSPYRPYKCLKSHARVVLLLLLLPQHAGFAFSVRSCPWVLVIMSGSCDPFAAWSASTCFFFLGTGLFLEHSAKSATHTTRTIPRVTLILLDSSGAYRSWVPTPRLPSYFAAGETLRLWRRQEDPGGAAGQASPRDFP